MVNLSEADAAAGIDLPREPKELVATWKWQRKAALVVEYAETTGTGVYDRSAVTEQPRSQTPRSSSASA